MGAAGKLLTVHLVDGYSAAAVKKMAKLVQEAAADATRSLGGRWPSAK